jgi:hypothetical protein
MKLTKENIIACQVCGVVTESLVICPDCKPNNNQKLKAMRAWHRIVVERAGSTCEDCGHSASFESGELCGDHIETQGARPDLRFDVSNGRCVCLPCHNKRHSEGLSPKLRK